MSLYSIAPPWVKITIKTHKFTFRMHKNCTTLKLQQTKRCYISTQQKSLIRWLHSFIMQIWYLKKIGERSHNMQ